MESREKTKEQLEEDLRKTREELGVQKWGIEKTLGGMKVLVKELIQKGKEVEEAKAKDEAILMSVGDGLIATDEKGNVTLINKIAEKLFDKKSEEVIGKSFFEVIVIEDEKGVPIPLEKRPIKIALAGTTTTTTTSSAYYYVRENKTKFPAAIMVTPIILDGKITGAIGVFRDITKEKEIDKAKSEFVSLASHQLRTPLGIIKWYLEAWKNEDYFKKSPQVIRGYFDEVYKSNERVLSLVRDLLSVSRIEQGRVKDVPKSVNILEIITDTLTQMQVLAKSKKVTLYLELKAQTLPSMYLDPLRFHEVIENLIANAIEYTPALGKVDVVVDTSNESILITVKDLGIGISEEDQKKLFTKFFRSQEAIKNNPEGSGLGLYVVKSYVEQWGGKITVSSVEGKGSTFSVSLPISGKKNV